MPFACAMFVPRMLISSVALGFELTICLLLVLSQMLSATLNTLRPGLVVVRVSVE